MVELVNAISVDAWITVSVLVLTLVVLARDLFPPAATILSAVIILLVTGVVGPEEAFSGFSNPAPITVAALYVIARAVETTGVLQPLVGATLGAGRSWRRSLTRLVVPTTFVSAFLNNTPIVAMLVPQVSHWAERRGHSPSRYMMPLSFAAILGGMLTAIGTSTNLVISGLLESHGHPPLGMFEISKVGLPVVVVGLFVIVVLTPVVIPERRAVLQDLEEEFREFVVTMLVERGGPLDGRSVEEARLRDLEGVFLVEITRGGDLIAPVTPSRVLQGGDLLTFVGKVDLVVDLQSMPGLVSAELAQTEDLDVGRHTFFEAVLSEDSPLVGRTLKDASFRAQFQAAVVALHRAGQRVEAKLGEVKLRVGDTLLILADPEFGARWRDRNDFLLVSSLGAAPPTTTRRAWIVGVVAVAIVFGSALGLMPILHLSLFGAALLVILGVLTPFQARQAVDINVILVIASAFGLGAAMEASGLAEFLAATIIEVLGPFGTTGVLFGLVLTTILLLALVTNNAAAVLMFPIGISVASSLGEDVRLFAITIAITASVSFLTPIAYQTNLMVYGPGGYRFSDYFRLGGFLTLVVIPVILLTVRLVGSV